MKLLELVSAAGLQPPECVGDVEVSSMVMDSRQAKPGAIFVCMPEANTDSQSFIPSAASNGAVAAVVFNAEGVELARKAGLAALRLPSDKLLFNDAIWRLCRAFFDSPTRKIRTIGVTGTNGKSTTAWLLRDMLVALGVRAGYIGTLGVQLPGESRELANTTPFSVELYNLLNEARERGTEALAMEVSSHALAEKRADGVEFDAAIFTNLTQDHLDFHQTMEAYALAKHRLFTDLPQQTEKRFVGAFNIDEPIGRRWAVEQNGPSVTFGLQQREADLFGIPLEIKVDRMRLKLDYRGEITVDIPIGGHFNVSNCLSAAAGMLALGYDLGTIGKALPSVRPVPGRFEAVANEKGIGIIIDYAHTPDALEKLLDSVRELKPQRILTVFGCGGDRDKSKRPKMGFVSGVRSDITILTSDNPRTEDPSRIISDIRGGMIGGRDVFAIEDRRDAVAHAIKMASPGDVVVIAGKGHENYQVVGRNKYPLDDRQLATEALN